MLSGIRPIPIAYTPLSSIRSTSVAYLKFPDTGTLSIALGIRLISKTYSIFTLHILGIKPTHRAYI